VASSDSVPLDQTAPSAVPPDAGAHDTTGRGIPRVAVELPREALLAIERSTVVTGGNAYRSHGAAHADNGTRWYPVIVRPAPSRGRALVWPAVRTAVPAGASAALLGSLIYLAGTLDPVGIVGTALGGVLSAVVARTQYKLEREQHALGSLWLAADYTRVLLGRFDSLGARLTGRARWYVVPLDALCPAGEGLRRGAAPVIAGTEELTTEGAAPLHPPPKDKSRALTGEEGLMAAWLRWQARLRRVGFALGVLGVDPATVDAITAERVYTLSRLARFVRFARGV
jgi:hypothetical protein